MQISYDGFVERLAKWRSDIGMTPEVTSPLAQLEKFEEERFEAAKEVIDCIVCIVNYECMADKYHPRLSELGRALRLLVNEDEAEHMFGSVIEKLESRVGSGKWIDGKYVKKEDL